MRRTKIVCTLGPASRNKDVIAQMLKNGMNVARLNFSHGTHEYHKESIELFRRVRDEMGVPAAIMLDTRGPEVRVCEFEDGRTELVTGQEFVLTSRKVLGNDREVSVTYADLPAQLSVGQKVLIDDGRIMLSVKQCTETDVICEVKDGGEISNRKSINFPNVHLEIPFLSETDKRDLIFGIENDVDFVAASFVRCGEDVIAMRKFLDYHGGHSVKIISKIENIEGVNNFDDILRYSDGIMVARGDMGVEIDYEKLPGLQKKFIRKCYQSGKMVITATQMLESMIHNATPTRAEITDVANAIFDGTSAIMLSGETAMGDHPARVVKVMSKIATQAEQDAFDMDVYRNFRYDTEIDDVTNAICDAACTTARDVGARAIIAVTKSGLTARRVSKFRPHELIVASTPESKTYHQLSLSWGVYPVLALNQTNEESLFIHAVDCAKQIDAVKTGDCVVITAGVPVSTAGNTNLLKVAVV